MADTSWAVLIVDRDDGFVDDTKGLLASHTIHTARNMTDAQREEGNPDKATPGRADVGD